MRDADEEQMAISVAAIAEIQSGILRFGPRILSLDLWDALAWGEVMGRTKQAGRPVPQVDALLAAVCGTRKLVLVLRNIKDFESLEVGVLDPFPGRAADPTCYRTNQRANARTRGIWSRTGKQQLRWERR